MTKILALSGRKQSGKNTAANYIIGTYLAALQIVQGSITVHPDTGALWITDFLGDPEVAGELDMDRKNPYAVAMFDKYINPYVKQYSFADLLKQEVCVNILGLTSDQCYGTNEQKNTPTHLKWEDMPGIITDKTMDYMDYDGKGLGDYHLKALRLTEHAEGPMTGRDVMQYVGTDLFRKMYYNVWATATLNKILRDDSSLAVITDCRFPNEVEAVQKAGGKVVRFTRDLFDKEDVHASETALDPENFDNNKFDFVIDNAKMTIREQNEALYDVLRPIDYVPENL